MLTCSSHQLENKNIKPDCTLQKTYKAPTTKQIINVPQAAALQGRCDKAVNYSVGNRITDVNRRVQEVNPLSLLVYDKEWWSPQKLRKTSCPYMLVLWSVVLKTHICIYWSKSAPPSPLGNPLFCFFSFFLRGLFKSLINCTCMEQLINGTIFSWAMIPPPSPPILIPWRS